MSRPRAPLAAVLLAALAAGCGADDRTMVTPSPDQTTTTAPPVTEAGATDAPAAFELTTSAFTPGTVIPDRYTCHGMDVWPDLTWSNVPEGTQALALVMRDLTAEGTLHWVVTGIDPALGAIAEGELPDGATEATNYLGEPGWAGPCPPPGSGEHTYELRVHALAEEVEVEAGSDGAAAVQAIESAPSYGSAVVLGTASPIEDAGTST